MPLAEKRGVLCVTQKFGCSYHYHHHRRLVQFSRESNLQVPREPQKTLRRPLSSQLETWGHNAIEYLQAIQYLK